MTAIRTTKMDGHHESKFLAFPSSVAPPNNSHFYTGFTAIDILLFSGFEIVDFHCCLIWLFLSSSIIVFAILSVLFWAVDEKYVQLCFPLHFLLLLRDYQVTVARVGNTIITVRPMQTNLWLGYRHGTPWQTNQVTDIYVSFGDYGRGLYFFFIPTSQTVIATRYAHVTR